MWPQDRQLAFRQADIAVHTTVKNGSHSVLEHVSALLPVDQLSSVGVIQPSLEVFTLNDIYLFRFRSREVLEVEGGYEDRCNSAGSRSVKCF
jgi:hypothetical protein